MELFLCPVCSGRGWVQRAQWPQYCGHCGGRGKFSAPEIARSIGEEPRTFERVLALRCRPATAERTFNKLMDRWFLGGEISL